MKKGTIIGIVVAVCALFLFAGGCSSYNGMVDADQSVQKAWGQVENQYQRRADLIPNLVNTVKGYAQHERATLAEVTDARTRATSINLDVADLTPETLAEFQRAQAEVGSALGRLIAVAESYPDLKANQNFLEFQSQIEGTENRIGVARQNYNTAAMEYNRSIRRFPTNILAGMFGFDRKPLFEANEGSQNAPTVEF